MLKNQFILTTKNLGKPRVKIGDFNLYFEGELTRYKDYYLLGYAYDWEHPEYKNWDILKDFNPYKCSGRFILILKLFNGLLIRNDTCSQYEIYYDDTFNVFASQPNLIQNVINCKPGNEFYRSEQFLSKGYFVGDETHLKNIWHLMPNYIINTEGSVKRFFPTNPILTNRSVKETATKACKILKGYIKAASLRKKLAIPVTAGYDTRTLFGASLDIDCEYFIVKDQNMKCNDPDIITALRVMDAYSKDYKIVSSRLVKAYNQYIDFPQITYENPDIFNNYQILNGNISEIARNWWGNYDKVTPKLLAYLNGYAGNKYVMSVYERWLDKNSELFKKNNLDVIDMFYWEERHGNWCAKANQVIWNRDIWLPYNSRELLCLLLSVNTNRRDYYFNELYDEIIFQLAPELKSIPINPFFRTRVIKLMKKLRIYRAYKQLTL